MSGSNLSYPSSRKEAKSCMRGGGLIVDHHQNEYVQVLENELERLRESTKVAIHLSWDEVESLQRDLQEHLDLAAAVESDLLKSHENEEYWRRRCIEAERIVEESTRASSPTNYPLRRKNSMSNIAMGKFFSKIQRPTSTSGLSEMTGQCDDDDSSCDSQDSESSVRIVVKHLTERVRELEATVLSRDDTIEKLLKETTQQRLATNEMEREMKCMMESQRIKQQHQNHQIQLIKARLDKKESQVKGLESKLSKCRSYVDELAGELEKTLKIMGRDTRRRCRRLTVEQDCDQIQEPIEQ